MRGAANAVTRLALVLALALWTAFSASPAAAVKIEKVVSPGGIVAWLVHDATVPVISVSFAFRAGAVADPAGKEGRAAMAAGLLDEGAGELDSQAFQGRLEDIAASIAFSAGRERFRGTLRTLSGKRDEAFRLLRLALTAARFDPEPVARIRAQMIAALKDDAEDPRTIARRTWYRTVFPDHPYGRPVDGTPASVAAITVAELKDFVARYLARDSLRIGVVGDIAADELARRLDEVFGALPARAVPIAIPAARVRNAGKLVVVERAIPQSVVVFGEQGIRRDDPDWYAASVMNRILGGGGFSSRLTAEVREKRGLAYAVYSYLNPFDHGGLIMGGVASANGRIAKSLEIIRREWRRMAKDGVGDRELASAKTYINGSFPLRLDSSRRIADILVAVQMSDLGIDYLDRRPALIDAVTVADIRRVARRLLKPERLTVVVVGKPAGLRGDP